MSADAKNAFYSSTMLQLATVTATKATVTTASMSFQLKEIEQINVPLI